METNPKHTPEEESQKKTLETKVRKNALSEEKEEDGQPLEKKLDSPQGLGGRVVRGSFGIY